MSESTCVHELPTSQCSYCQAKPAYSGVFWDAKYEQSCGQPGCASPIKVGDRLRWSNDGTKAIHAKHR